MRCLLLLAADVAVTGAAGAGAAVLGSCHLQSVLGGKTSTYLVNLLTRD